MQNECLPTKRELLLLVDPAKAVPKMTVLLLENNRLRKNHWLSLLKRQQHYPYPLPPRVDGAVFSKRVARRRTPSMAVVADLTPRASIPRLPNRQLSRLELATTSGWERTFHPSRRHRCLCHFPYLPLPYRPRDLLLQLAAAVEAVVAPRNRCRLPVEVVANDQRKGIILI